MRLIPGYLAMFLTTAAVSALAGVTPQPGDLTTLQATGNGNEYAACITLVANLDLRQITAADNGWLNTNAFRTGEGLSTPTSNTAARNDVPLGAVIAFVPALVDNNAADGFLGAPSSGIAFSTTGDQIFIFRGTSAAPTLLCGLTSYRRTWQSNATDSNTSALPPGAAHYAAVGQAPDHHTDVYFSMTTPPSDSFNLKAARLNPANWTGNQSPALRFADRSFSTILLTSNVPDFSIFE